MHATWNRSLSGANHKAAGKEIGYNEEYTDMIAWFWGKYQEQESATK